jgi:hypothetical protein
MDQGNQAKQHAGFITVTCLGLKHVLQEDRFKNIITDSLSFLSGNLDELGYSDLRHFTGFIEAVLNA